MNNPRTTCAPRPDVSRERDVLSAIYRRAIERYEEKQKGSRPAAPDDAERRSSDGARTIIPESS